MPNRILKESICTSEDLNRLSSSAEILFYRLIVKADDYGTFHGNPAIVKNICFPLKSDDIKLKQVESWLSELVSAGLIYLYKAEDGRQYLQFAKWEKHQQVRAKKPKFPTYDCNCEPLSSYVPVIQSNSIQYEGAHAHKYGEYGWVKLSDTQYQKLQKELGQDELDRCIRYVDECAQQTGNKNKWKDWNLVIRRCNRDGWGSGHEANSARCAEPVTYYHAEDDLDAV